MGNINPQIVLDFETNLSTIIENEYNAFGQNLWWDKVAKVRTSNSHSETIAWLLSTAQIRDQGQGGNVSFDDLVSRTTTIENKYAGAGFKIRKALLEDVYNGLPGGKAFELGSEWASQIGQYMAYWPQKKTAWALQNGHTASLFTGYDGKALFATDHPLNPYNSAAGTYSNLLTGSGTYAIDDSVSVDVALVNLSKVVAAIQSIKMPNGEDPRFLEPEAIICSPRMMPRLVQLTSAKTIAQAASSGGGGADVEALIKYLGFATPIRANELAGFESDTTYFVVCKQASSSQLGGIIYQQRQAFEMQMYGPMTESELGRKQELEWNVQGRNAIAPGHPYLIFKVKATV